MVYPGLRKFKCVALIHPEMVKETPAPEEADSEVGKIMGFSDFSSTKNCNHSPSSVEAVFKTSRFRRKYRVFMNRGPADPSKRTTREA